MSTPQLITPLFSSIATPLLEMLTQTSSNVAGVITPTATTLFLIYICFWAWSMARGLIQEPILDAVGRLVKLSIIYAIALNAVHYATFVIEFFWKTPEAMAAVIVSNPSISQPDGMTLFLDELLFTYYKYAEVWLKAAETNRDSWTGIPKISQLIIGYLLMVLGMINIAIAGFFILLAKVATAILLAIGPIFILSIMFESTKKLFDAWVGQVLNYVFVFVLIACAMAIVGIYVGEQVLLSRATDCGGSNDANATCSADPNMSNAVIVATLTVINVFFYFLIPGIASALGGGVALQSLGAVGWAYARAKGALGGAAREASGRGLAERRQARMQRARAQRWARNNPGLSVRTYRGIKRTPEMIRNAPQTARNFVNRVRGNTVSKT